MHSDAPYMTLSHTHSHAQAAEQLKPFQASADAEAGLYWRSIPDQSGEEATSFIGSQARDREDTCQKHRYRPRKRGRHHNGQAEHFQRFIVEESGEKSTKKFRKTREMTFLPRCRRRQPGLPRAGAHRNGLREVEEARTSPLHPQKSHRLVPPFSDFLLKYLVYFTGKFGKYPT